MAMDEMTINLRRIFRHHTVGKIHRFQLRDGSQRWVEADVTVTSRGNIVAESTVEAVKIVILCEPRQFREQRGNTGGR